jgi:hypothetical protein
MRPLVVAPSILSTVAGSAIFGANGYATAIARIRDSTSDVKAAAL